MLQELFTEFICPQCKSPSLQLNGSEILQGDILTGSVICEDCRQRYQIKDGIPYFIDPEMLEKISDTKTPSDSSASQVEVEDVTLANARFHNIVFNEYENDASTIGMCEEGCASQKRIEDTLQKISMKAGNEFFLDMGCGTGNVLKIARKYFKKSLGIDISVGMLQVAKQRNLNVSVGDVYQSFLQTNSLNMVACAALLHHLYDPGQYFSEIYRILKPGGYFYTDWDPNKIADRIFNLVTHQTRTFIYVLFIYNLLRDKKKKPTDYQASDELKDLAEVAEYQLNRSQGLEPKSLKQQLLEVGFREVEVIYIYNNSSVFRDLSLLDKIKLRTRIILGNKLDILKEVDDIRELAPHFALLARK